MGVGSPAGHASSFTNFLDEFADLVLYEPEFRVKHKYFSIDGTEERLKPVTKSIEHAYEEYYKDRSCPLEYEMYAKFVSACRAWGTLVHNWSLWDLDVEDKEAFDKRRDRYRVSQSKGPTGTALIVALLDDLKRLAESTDRKVEVLYNDRQKKRTAAREKDETWERTLAVHAESVKRRQEEAKEKEETENERKEKERVRREAEAHGIYFGD